jgi:glycosyltransferase involved in cell wall biosynthesis
VVVSDDSDDDVPTRELAEQYPFARYVRGPRLGLGANRNRALEAATGDLVLFLDDDCHLGPDFVSLVRRRAAEVVAERRGSLPIVTCTENKRGELVRGSDQDFLGFHRRPYRHGQRRHTVVINAAVFPREVFHRIRFDEQLRYGYDEVDIATRATAEGYDIVEEFRAENFHFPSSVNREEYAEYIAASRVYVTFKRWWATRRRRAWAVGYLTVALGHVLASDLHRQGLAGIATSMRTSRLALGYVLHYLRTPGWDRRCS